MKIKIFSILAALISLPSGAQTFTNATTTNLPASGRGELNSMDAAVGDLDGDGDLDIVVGVEFLKNIILINDGNGKFTEESHRLPDLKVSQNPIPYSYYPYHDTEDIALADFDNDGDLDIVFITEDDQTNEYYVNDGKGNFSNASDKLPVGGISNAVIAADFDDDGFVDLMIGNNGQNFYLKNNRGKWVDETKLRLPVINDITQDLGFGDFDGDGDIDVIVGNEKENVLLINDGKGYFSDETGNLIDPDFQVSGETREAEFADINMDGKMDLFFANVFMFQQMKPIQRLLINTDNGFADETEKRLGFSDNTSCVDVKFKDLNNDGAPDLILTTTGGPLILINDGKGFFTNITSSAIGNIKGMGVDAEAADFNGDGKPDLYFSNFRGSDLLFIQN